MRGIPNTTLGTGFSTLFEGDLGYGSGFLQVYNALVEVLLVTGPGQGQRSEGDPIPVPPGILPLSAGLAAGARPGDLIYGASARIYPGTTPSPAPQILGAVYRPGDATAIVASPLTQTLSSSGVITGATAVITGIVNGNGTVAAGTGFTVNRTAPGTYTVSFTSAFSSVPVVLVTCVDATTPNRVLNVFSVTASGFSMIVETAADEAWNFTAQAPT